MRSPASIAELVRPAEPAVVPSGAADHLTDQQLVTRALRGDGWAEEVLFRRHVASLTATVIRLLASRHDAEDVVQESFVAAFGSLPTLRDAEAFQPWLTKIAVSKVYRIFRRQRLLRSLGFRRLDEDGYAEIGDPSADPEIRAELVLLDAQLAKLPAAHRIAWALRRIEGMPLDEVATACDCSLATAKRRIAAADEKVRRHVRMEDGRG
jgi:RNA polymerase sigma-70 factor (ECF subfamily)